MKKKEKISRKKIKKSIDINQLTEAIIKKIIVEQDIVLDDPLVRIFISPFTDVIKTAKGEAEKFSTTIWTNTLSLAKQAACLAIPFIAASTINDIQKESDQKLKERLAQIDASYADVLKRNWDTLRSRDVWGITFLLNPAVGIATKFLMKAPYQSLGILEILSGRNPKVVALREKAKVLATHVSPNYGGGGGGGSGGGDYGGYGGMDGLGYGGDLGTADYSGDGGLMGDAGGGGMGESLFFRRAELLEQQQQQQAPATVAQQPQQKKMISQKQFNNILASQIEALKKDPEIVQALQASPVVQQMQSAALEAVMSAARPILKANSYDQLKSALGQEFGKFEQQMKKTLPAGATPEQEKQFKEELVPQIKVLYKKMLTQQLQKQVGSNKALIKPMQQLITQINKG